MAQNLTINGVTYSSVTSLSIPKSAGGNAVFPDTSDADAAAGDIASGKTAYVNGIKIAGTATGGGTYQEKSVTPSASQQVITPDTGYDAMTKVTVAGDADLISNNIKSGKNIFGVAGSTNVVDTTIGLGCGATSRQIEIGQKAYVNGQLLTGTAPMPREIMVAYDATSVGNFARVDPPFIIAVYAPAGDVGTIMINANGDGVFNTDFNVCSAQYDDYNYEITFDMTCYEMFAYQSVDDYVFVDVTNDNYLP